MTFLLNEYGLYHYLLGKNGGGRVPERIRCAADSKQHALFNVEWADGTKWFVKQPFCPHSLETFTIVNEAKLTRKISTIPALSACSPGFIDFNRVHKILITEGLTDYASLRTQNIAPISELLIKRQLPEKVAIVMASYHLHLTRWAKSLANDSPFHFFKPPFLLNHLAFINPLLDEKSSSFIDRKRLSSLFFQTKVDEILRELNTAWTTNTLIHADASAHNILVGLVKGDELNVKICDWQYAGWGDPDWDCTCFFQELLLAYMDMRVNRSIIINAVRSFYHAYLDVFKCAYPRPFQEWFFKVVKLAATGILEKMLATLATSGNGTDEDISDSLDFLINGVLINPNLLKSF